MRADQFEHRVTASVCIPGTSFVVRRTAEPTGRIKYGHHPNHETSISVEVVWSQAIKNGRIKRILRRLFRKGDPGPVTIKLHTTWVNERDIAIEYKPIVKIYDCETKSIVTIN